jgi:hypothetical protein
MSDAMIQPVIEENAVEYGISTVLISREHLLNPNCTYRDFERRYEGKGPLYL